MDTGAGGQVDWSCFRFDKSAKSHFMHRESEAQHEIRVAAPFMQHHDRVILRGDKRLEGL